MGRKRLITDSFPGVKKSRGHRGPGDPCKGEEAADTGSNLAPPFVCSGTLRESQQPPVEEAVLDLLRQFDLAWQYGPCTGITRFQRWERADRLGLSPPTEVLRVLWAHPGNPSVQFSLWHPYPL
ncbi:DNA polymerase delta subunit 4 isoform X1 [Ornithorhynchus anatinus]|uniref:DNA polymerase delta subunit 4 isoform X1 n=1 Tax=Ornithorhynchus anatinus TaxID=9258 RepID=UPI0010A84265|nr:DNA polymerase delta subunit 4 isoform X1 [Ornithorhynchus anatinus]